MKSIILSLVGDFMCFMNTKALHNVAKYTKIVFDSAKSTAENILREHVYEPNFMG